MIGPRSFVHLAMVILAAPAALAAAAPTAEPPPLGIYSTERKDHSLVIKSRDVAVLEYQLAKPADSKLSVESGCYIHPLATPSGTVITEVAPADHLHHRGVFLGFVEMHGKKDADFWGWGEHAPKNGRMVVNREVKGFEARPKEALFRAQNDWVADGEVLIKEELTASVTTGDGHTVVDLTYVLTPESDATVSRWAFSGFCVRLRKDGEVEALGPKGKVEIPDPVHTQPESDWPAAAWYDFTLKLPDGKVAGAAVIDHPRNPPSLWHNHRALRMLNPCVVATRELVLKARAPLTLRYRVVAHDGPAPVALIEKLSRELATPAVPAKFAVILKSAGARKIAVIKEVREITGLGLRDARDLVNGAPKPVKEGISWLEAEMLKKKIEAAGGQAEVR